MYAAFAARVRELGMLQSLGFPRRAIMISLMQESLLASAAGTLIGALLGMLLLDGRAVKFSMGVFQLTVDYRVLLLGIAAGFIMGILGANTSCVEMFAPPHNRSSQGLMKERKSHDSDQQDVRKPSHYYRNDGCNYFVSTRFSDVRQNGETGHSQR